MLYIILKNDNTINKLFTTTCKEKLTYFKNKNGYLRSRTLKVCFFNSFFANSFAGPEILHLTSDL